MRRITVLTGAAIGAVIYLGSPMLAAWEVRQAIRASDKATLERRVDWTSVRATLNRSLGPAQEVLTEISEAAGAPKPGLWSRIIKATVPMLSGTAIDYYVTPEGVPQLYAWRETWRQKVRPAIGLAEPRMALAGTPLENTSLDKILSLLKRVDRAAFTGPTRLELEVRDRYAEHRSYRAVMELKGMTWMLTEVEVLSVAPPKPTTQPVAQAS
ncbi:MAG: DUF2939 domain-containing protein [Hyphomicrobiaceae bacterium]